jgi:hypothetical protein
MRVLRQGYAGLGFFDVKPLLCLKKPQQKFGKLLSEIAQKKRSPQWTAQAPKKTFYSLTHLLILRFYPKKSRLYKPAF